MAETLPSNLSNEQLLKMIAELQKENVKLKKNQRKKKIFNPISLYSKGERPYDKVQQEEFIKEEEEGDIVVDITEPRGNFLDPKTGDVKSIELQKHQKKFIEKFINGDARGAVIFHGTGTGKTITAVATSSAYLRYNPNGKVYVITPSATLQNYIFGMVQWGLDIRDNRYKFYTYDRYYREKPSCKDSLMIVDEAHNFRTPIKEKKITKEDPETGDLVEDFKYTNVKGRTLLENCAKVADKVLLLTATPFVNVIYDIENLIAMVNGRDPIDDESFVSRAMSSAGRKDYFRCLVSKFELPVGGADFPDKIEKIIPIYMDEEFLKKYNPLERSNDRRITAYYNAVRRISNSYKGANNDKVDWVVNLLTKSNEKGLKSVVYTTFLETGILLLKERLDRLGYKYAEITGKQTSTGKEISKNRFNHFVPDDANYKKQVRKLGIDADDKEDYDVNILLITKASAEGVDLIGTRNMVLMDGAWNEATIQQIIARAVRYRSHSHLPKKERFVNIYRMLLVKPTDDKLIKKIANNEFPQWKNILGQVAEATQTLRELGKTEKKMKKIEFKAKTLKEKTIEGRIFKNQEVIKDLLKFRGAVKKEGDLMTKNEVKELPTELKRKLIVDIESRMLSTWNAEREAMNLSRPSIDLYMMIRSMSKQLAINNFVDALSNVETIEQCISPLEQEYNKIIGEKQEKGQVVSPAEKDKLRLELYGKGLQKFADLVLDGVNETMEDLQKILQKDTKRREAILKKAVRSNFQELFTPPQIVDEMLKRVGILDDLRDDLRVLEPSAGEGAMVLPLIQNMAKGKQFYLIDLVEIVKESRQVLQSYGNATDNIHLMAEGNFMKFIPQDRYDYVVMNPPFHLKRSDFPTIFKRDVYDVDFVMRAFSMLKVGGKLIAIISRAFINNNKYPFGDFNKFLDRTNSSYEEATRRWKGTISVNKAKQERMRKLGLNNFVFVEITKEKGDDDMFSDLINVDYENTIMGKPKMISKDIPVEFLENNKNQIPVKVEYPSVPRRKPPPIPKTKPPPIPKTKPPPVPKRRQ
jgi:hypothetical protein